MSARAYYNEIDPYAAQWLRNLIAAGLIAPGDVDERSIEDVTPYDLIGYTQCHFFAGIGVWSLALRGAGWPDSRPVWTGSCPCQPFSSAGKGGGFNDERHLWPAFYHLIEQCNPPVVFGEQVAAKAVEPWVDLVQTDLEAVGYAFGAIAFPSCSVGGPHRRERAYWVADPNCSGCDTGCERCSTSRFRETPNSDSCLSKLGDPGESFQSRLAGDDCAARRKRTSGSVAEAGVSGSVEHADMSEQYERSSGGEQSIYGQRPELVGMVNTESEQERVSRLARQYGATRGYWAAADWIPCRDGYWRPVQPGFKQMVDGSTRSLGELCPGTVEKIEKEINDWSIEHQRNIGKALSDVRRSLEPEAQRVRETGRLSSVLEAPVLLAFLRQFETQRGIVSQGISRPSPQETETLLRVLWYDDSSTGASRRRELDEQYRRESTDPLHLLSSILAQNACSAWPETKLKNACDTFPLAKNISNRSGKTRAYGNAINAIQAQVFIESYLNV